MADFSYVNLPKAEYDRFVADTTNKIWAEVKENDFKGGKSADEFFAQSKEKLANSRVFNTTFSSQPKGSPLKFLCAGFHHNS